MSPDRHDIPIIGDYYSKKEVDTMIAAALMAIAQRLYKTHLSEKEYKRLMEEIINHPDVEPYEVEKVRLH